MYFTCSAVMPSKKDMAMIINNGIFAGDIKGETDIPGLRIDFNAGLRMELPAGSWHVRVRDGVSGRIFFDSEVTDGRVQSLEQYYIPWEIEAWRDGELVFSHRLDFTEQKVYLYITGSVPESLPPLGEAVQMLSCARAFLAEHPCRLAVRPGAALADIARRCYPEFEIVENMPEDAYATYHLGTFNEEPYFSPTSGRCMPWQDYARELLNLSRQPEIDEWRPGHPRPSELSEPYVCIAVQASGGRKCWLYPGGWDEVVGYLRTLGYRVLCLDKEKSRYDDGQHIEMPEGAEDFTGSRPLAERLEVLAYADMFIGVSSGLSWLAQAARCPVVLISGITMSYTEFFTPYRISNCFSCRGCFTDPRIVWGRDSICPRHQGTDRELECSRSITPGQVIEAIEQVRRDRADKGR